MYKSLANQILFITLLYSLVHGTKEEVTTFIFKDSNAICLCSVLLCESKLQIEKYRGSVSLMENLQPFLSAFIFGCVLELGTSPSVARRERKRNQRKSQPLRETVLPKLDFAFPSETLLSSIEVLSHPGELGSKLHTSQGFCSGFSLM